MELSLESLRLWTLSNVRNSKYLDNTKYRKKCLFLSPDEGRKTPTPSCPIERTNFNHPNRISFSLPPPKDGKKSSFQNAVFLLFRIPGGEQNL
jgi:hypothetical protein